MKRLMTVLAAFCGLAALAEDYNLPAGESDTLSEEATYGAMTIGGDLSAYVPEGASGAIKSIMMTSLALNGGTVTIDSNGGSEYFYFGKAQTASNGGVPVTISDDGEKYGFVTVKNMNAAVDTGFGAMSITLAKESEEFRAENGVIDFARIENGALFVRQLYNNSSFTGRVTIAGGGTSYFCRRGGAVASSFVTTGPFIVRLQDNSTWNFSFYNSRGAVNAANQVLQCEGDGNVFINSRKYSGNNDAHFRNGALFNQRGTLTFGADGGKEASFNIDAGNIIGPNVTKLILNAGASATNYIILADGIALRVPDVESSANAVFTVGNAGAATVQVDATELARKVSLNIAAEENLTIEKLGMYDLNVSATANIPTLKLHGGAAKFTSDCSIKALDCTDGGCVIAGDGAVVLIESGAAAMTGTLTPPPGVTEWPEGDHVMCYFKGNNPDLTKILAPSIPGKAHVISIVDGTGEYEGWKALKLTASAVTPVSATWVGAGADDAVTTAENWEGAPALDFGNGSVAATFATDGNRAEVSGLAWFNSILFTAAGGFTVAKGDAAATVGLYGDSLSATGAGTYAFEPAIRAFGAANVSVGPEAKLVVGNGIVAENGQVTLTATDAGAEVELRGTNVISGQLHATDSNVKLTLSGLITNPDGVDTRAAKDIKGVNDDPNAFAFYGSQTRNVYLDNVTMEKAFCASAASSNKGRALWALANTTNRFCAGGYFYSTWGSVYADQGSQVVFEKDVRSGNGFCKYGGGELVVRGEVVTGTKQFQLRDGTVRVEHPDFEAKNMTVSAESPSTSCMLEIATNVVDVGMIAVGAQYSAYVECLVKINAGFEAGFSSLGKTAASLDRKARVTGEDGSIVCMKAPSVLDIRMDGGLGVKADCGMDGVVVLTNRAYEATGPLIAQTGVLELDSTASWAGTNLVVRGTSAESYGTLRVASNANFQNRRFDGVVEGSGKFELASGVRLKFNQLTVDGEKVEPGTYTKYSTGVMAGHILGNGCVVVRGGGLVMVVR